MMLDGMSDSIQGSRIENLHSREVYRQSPTGLILFFIHKNVAKIKKVKKKRFLHLFWRTEERVLANKGRGNTVLPRRPSPITTPAEHTTGVSSLRIASDGLADRRSSGRC